MQTTKLLSLLVVLLIISGLLWAWVSIQGTERSLSINTYEECVAAGYPIMESYPSRCATPDGRVFTNPNESITPSTTTSPITANGCQVGGCSAQLCGEAGDDLVSNCEYRPEYGCYQSYSTCERQPSGKCGWTPTPALAQCLEHPVVPQGNAQSGV